MARFNVTNDKVCQKFGKNCVKTLKKGKFWDFCQFRCQLDFFFIRKTAIISSEKPTGQRSSAMLSVFHILIHEVYRRFDKY